MDAHAETPPETPLAPVFAERVNGAVPTRKDTDQVERARAIGRLTSVLRGETRIPPGFSATDGPRAPIPTGLAGTIVQAMTFALASGSAEEIGARDLSVLYGAIAGNLRGAFQGMMALTYIEAGLKPPKIIAVDVNAGELVPVERLIVFAGPGQGNGKAKLRLAR